MGYSVIQFCPVLLGGMTAGVFICNYTDGKLKRVHRVTAKRTLIIAVLNTLLWCGAFWVFGFQWVSLLYALASTALLGLSLVDLAIFEIPPEFNVFLAILGGIRILLDLKHWYEYIIGGCLVSGIFLLIILVSKGKAMGGGDMKLMAAAGLLIGWKKILLALALGAVFGSVIHLTLMAVSKKEKVLSFGPYLSAGIYVSILFGDRMIGAYMDYLSRVAERAYLG